MKPCLSRTGSVSEVLFLVLCYPFIFRPYMEWIIILWEWRIKLWILQLIGHSHRVSISLLDRSDRGSCFWSRGSGEGDKASWLCGGLCGWKGAVFCIFGGAVLGTILLIPIYIWQRMSKSVSPMKINWLLEQRFHLARISH